MPGPIALVGSGEYLPVMDSVDTYLLSGRTGRVVMLPTAAGQESQERIDYWCELGTSHYRSLGVDSAVILVLDREDAFDPALTAQLADAGLIYLSGGSPAYLSETLRGTPIWQAIVDAWRSGAALAGCSAGACALTAISGGFRQTGQLAAPGLGLIDHLAVIPHFDHFNLRSPQLTTDLLEKIPPHLTLIGIDECTALVGGPQEFMVMGEQSVWWIDHEGNKVGYRPGTTITLRPNHQPAVMG